MWYQVIFPPGAKSKSKDIDLPSGTPPIDDGVTPLVQLFRCYDKSAKSSSAAEVASVSVSKVVDENTIQLDTATKANDLLIVRYHPKGSLRTVS